MQNKEFWLLPKLSTFEISTNTFTKGEYPTKITVDCKSGNIILLYNMQNTICMPGFSNGTLHTIIDTTLTGLDKIGEAHKLMESNENTGKIVLEVIREKHEEL